MPANLFNTKHDINIKAIKRIGSNIDALIKATPYALPIDMKDNNQK